MRRTQNLTSTLGIQKEKFGVTMHFSEIIKLQFVKKKKKKKPYHTSLFVLLFFVIIVA